MAVGTPDALSVELVNVSKSFSGGGSGKSPGRAVLRELSLTAHPGEFLVVLGPSGCGKSTCLRLIAGLERPDTGQVRIGGRVVDDVPPAQRGVGMVFQNYALYPHLSVRENIVFGLKVRRVPRAAREQALDRAAEMLGLRELLDRRPHQLSGGQRQRVALGRCVVGDAPVVLMDEPLSNLDARLRQQMRVDLRALQRAFGRTMIYVTHDQVEAMTMADRIVVMFDGQVEQVSTPVELYRRPATTAVARFVGSPPMNLIPGHLDEHGATRLGDSATGARRVLVGVRPEHLTTSAGRPQFRLAGHVSSVELLGAETLLGVECAEGTAVTARLTGLVEVAIGSPCGVGFSAENASLFDDETGRALPDRVTVPSDAPAAAAALTSKKVRS